MLVDNELQLVAPQSRWIDEVLVSANDPQSLAAGMPVVTRGQVERFLEACPLGHQQPDAVERLPATYHFWMRLNDASPLPMAGGISLRAGNGFEVEHYYGHLGYHVYPLVRGRHYAERACRLLYPLALRHGLQKLWITCNPENVASRRTCERLGARLIEVIPVPPDHRLYLMGDHEKCRYLVELEG